MHNWGKKTFVASAAWMLLSPNCADSPTEGPFATLRFLISLDLSNQTTAWPSTNAVIDDNV
jgi:hypothetical protein